MATISTHVLDTALGRPAAGIPVVLEVLFSNQSVPVADGITDDDGRVRFEGDTDPRRYRLTFQVADYLGDGFFYPEIAITFRIADGSDHYHVPLLLSPFGYTTYRGS